jgi:NADH-quinone oxidoreductase subunit F
MFYSPVITNANEVATSDRLHLFRYVEDETQHTLATFVAHGGYQAWKKVLTSMKREDVIAEVKNSGLRGRGGAGFPTGMKWSFVPKDSPKPRYLICNADESEPGTCKDRVIMERDPHAVIEGMAIAAYAIGCKLMFCYIRGEFNHSIDQVEAAMKEAYAGGHLGKNIYGSGYDLDMVVHTGGGAYICGEETALLNSLEGEKGMSRIRPPFPAIEGLYACPTIVNNVETVTAVPHIIKNGAAWYKTMGTEKSAGSKIFSLSGHVNRPGNYEVELGFPLRKMIYDDAFGAGIRNGKKLKAVIPGGASTPYLKPDMIDVGLDYESLASVGSMLGSGAIIVLDEDTSIVWSIMKLIQFFHHESCGKCTPCREGTAWLDRVITRIWNGDGRSGDVQKIDEVCTNILGRTICPLGDAAVMPIQSTIKHFRDEWEYHIQHKKPPCANTFAFK